MNIDSFSNYTTLFYEEKKAENNNGCDVPIKKRKYSNSHTKPETREVDNKTFSQVSKDQFLKLQANNHLNQNKKISPSSHSSFLFPEPPYKPQASIKWLNHLQEKINGCSSSEIAWIEEINIHPLGKDMKQCIDIFENYFRKNEQPPLYFIKNRSLKGTNFQNILDWTYFIQKVFILKESETKVDIICKLQIGHLLSQCAQIFSDVSLNKKGLFMPQIAGQINIMAEKAMSILIGHYFFSSKLWEKGLQAPSLSEPKVNRPLIEDLFKVIKNGSGDHTRAIILGFDTSTPKVYTARSGRQYAVAEREKQIWEQVQQCWEKSQANEATFFQCHFVEKKIERITSTILLGATERFWHLSSKKRDINHKNIGDINFSRGLFHEFIENLYEKNPESSMRHLLFNSLYYLFNDMLYDEKEKDQRWREFFELFVNDKWKKNSFRDSLMHVTRPPLSLRSRLSMLHSRLTCGEVSIFLECCRDLGKMSSDERASLPMTLKERINFFAAKPEDTQSTQNPSMKHSDKPSAHALESLYIGDQKVDLMDLCLKCKDLWVVYEAIYWAIRESGLALSSLELLDSRIQSYK